MKNVSTAILLVISLFAVPAIAYFFGPTPGDLEWSVLRTLMTITAISIAYTFIVGELAGNNSQVDKLWSILPIIYVWVIASYGDFSLRLVIMAILVSIWGIRLTVNFAMKGAYQWKFWGGEEDYRWKTLRQKKEFQPHWKWMFFNLLFICAYQNILILLFTLPALVALQFNVHPMNYFDYIVAGAMFLFIIYETIADIQQWNFQSKKWKLIKAGEELTGDYKKGFLDKGLWAFSRHPNYFAEQAIWVSFYFFSVAASGLWLNWTIAGFLLLLILFQGSSNFSEEISTGKYPEYKTYRKNVSRFFPFPKIRK